MSIFFSTRRGRVAAYFGAVIALGAIVAGVASAANPFVDVAGNPNAADIDATYNAGITSGCDATHFCPNDPLRRGDAAAYLARLAGLSTATAKRFPVANARSDTQSFCALAAASPRSFENGPCTGTVATVDSGSVGSDASIAIGADGLPVLSYFDAKNGDLKVAHCNHASCTTGATTAVIDATGVVGRNSSIAIGADGLPLISYYDVTNGDLKVAHCVNVLCAGNVTLSRVDTAGNVGHYSSLVIGADGNGVVAYHDVTNGDLKVARCTGAACTAVAAKPFDAAGIVGQFTAIALGADGLPAVTYFDATRKRLRFTRCATAACAGPGTTLTLDPGATAGEYSAIAIAPDGMPVISYYDRGAGDLKVARCVTAACGTGTTYAAVDTTGDVGRFSSIAIGTNGLPVVASYRVDGNNLRYARCLNAACSASTLRTLDTAGDVGQFASLAVGVDGVPIIGYHDLGSGTLKAARPPAA